VRTNVSAVDGIQAADGSGGDEAFALAFRIGTKSIQNLKNDVMVDGADLSGMRNLSSSQNDLYSPLTRDPAHWDVADLSWLTYKATKLKRKSDGCEPA